MVEVYFKNIEEQIVQRISVSEKRIFIAVAWFTNQRIMAELLHALKRKVEVKLVLLEDLINCSEFGLDFGKLADCHASIKFMKTHDGMMHNKFCIIDDIAITGSYNWTYQANKNQENVIFMDDEEIVMKFCSEFKLLFDRAIDINLPYKHLKWTDVKEGDFTELSQTLYRDIIAKNDINREIRKLKLMELDSAYGSGDSIALDKVSSMPNSITYPTIMDVLVNYPNEYTTKLWYENYGKEENVNILSELPRKWIFLPMEKRDINNLKGYLIPYSFIDDFDSGLPLIITEPRYIDALQKFLGNKDFDAYAYKSIPEELLCIEYAKVFYHAFPSPMFNKRQPRQWINTTPRHIFGVNVLGIGKCIEDGVLTDFYNGWNPSERGIAIQNEYFTK